MAGWHEAKQGETVSSIADRCGFRDYRTVYQHSANAELRKMRPNPDIIFPGDRIYIPEIEEKSVPAVTDLRHCFVLHSRYKVLRVRLQDFKGRPFIQTRYEVRFGLSALTGMTDEQGVLEQRIPVQVREATLKIEYCQWTLKIGDLNPIDDTPDLGATGIQMRLINLGYDPGPIDGIIGPRTTAAILGFQKTHPPLAVDGICGSETTKRLLQEHGS
jgi:hypothetical protein